MLAHFSYLLHEVVIEPIKIAEEIIYLNCSINAGASPRTPHSTTPPIPWAGTIHTLLYQCGGIPPHPPFTNATHPPGTIHTAWIKQYETLLKTTYKQNIIPQIN